MRKLYTLVIYLAVINATYAQQWTFAGGDTIISQYGGMDPYVCVDKTNIPYVVFFDQQYGGGCTVKKFINNSWVNVGLNLNVDYVYNTTMDFDTANVPYVVYRDGTTAKATVKRFDGTNWLTVGSAQFTPSGASFTSIKIGPDNVPYVAFRDVSQNYSASVMKFNGVDWVYVGTPGFSPQAPASGALRTSLAIDKIGTLYVAFVDLSNNWRASVMKYNGTNWVFVGNPNISGGGADATTLVVDSQNRPIISYIDGNAQVKRFNGTSWVSIGAPGFTSCDRSFLTIDKHDRLYLAYTFNERESAMKFNGNSWVQAGNAAFSPSVVVFNPTAAVDTSGNLFVAFTDGTERPWSPGSSAGYNGACVMMLTNNSIVTDIKQPPGSSSLLNIYPNPTNGMVRINYNPLTGEHGVLKISNLTGQTIYKEGFSGGFNKELNLSEYSTGIYLIEIKKSSEAIERRKIVLE